VGEPLHPVSVGAARFAVACVAAVAFAACGLATNGLEQGVGDGGPGGFDATGDVKQGEASFEAGGDTGPLPESGSDVVASDVVTSDVVPGDGPKVDGCVPKGPEICTNGIDDDCNGLTDCADPACTTQGYACVAIPPNGWDVAPLDPSAQPGCPTDLKQTDVDVNPTIPAPPATCSCTCDQTAAPSCEQGNIVVKAGPDATCGAGMMSYPASGGACVTQSVDVLPFAQITQPPTMGGTCTPQATTTVPPDGSKGQMCNNEAAFGAGCAAGQQCAHVPAGYHECIHHGGANMACPPGPYTVPFAVGTLQDNRGCTQCTCAPPTCGNSTWNFYSSNNCSGGVSISFPPTATCTGTGEPSGGTTYQSYLFSSQPNACAAPAPPMPTGGVQLNGQDTVCCD